MRPHRRLLLAVFAASLLLLAPPTATAGSRHQPRPTAVVRVVGDVAQPTSLTAADLAALPQTTLVDERPHQGRRSLTGVLLQTLVDDAQPRLPDAKNAALRVSVTVSGRHQDAVAAARGELDPAFGNHPALLVLSRDGHPLRRTPELVFPGDTNRARTVREVTRIDVAVASTGPVATPEGSVVVRSGRRSSTLSPARLARLPQQTRTVTFLASGAPQSHTETGPSLAAVLAAAHVRAGRSSTVAATGADGYVAVVTPGEQSSGARPLLLSLVEDGQRLTRPRLVADGDLRGGRYVTDVASLTVSASKRR